jgi:hypothetical protein
MEPSVISHPGIFSRFNRSWSAAILGKKLDRLMMLAEMLAG